jgi:hypothetical protein
VQVVTDSQASPRELYGASHLRTAVAPLTVAGRIVAATRTSKAFAEFGEQPPFAAGSAEAFRVRRAGDTILVIGSDPSGVLYGSLELARRIHQEGRLPASLDFADRPAFILRGANIGMQKTEVTYDGAIYDYRWCNRDPTLTGSSSNVPEHTNQTLRAASPLDRVS